MRKRNYVRVRQSSRDGLKTRVLLVFAALAAGYILVSFIFGEMGLVKFYRMKSQYNDLVEETSNLKRQNTVLLREVRALRTDTALIEQIARDKLGLARSGEIVYYYGQSAP